MIKANFQDLQKQYTNPLAPVYVVSGEETWQLNQAQEVLVHAAKLQNFDEILRIPITNTFDWSAIDEHYQSTSLFSSKQLIIINFGTIKPKKSAHEILAKWGKSPPADKCLCLITPKLESSTQKTKWFTALTENAVFCPVWPIEGRALLTWIQSRLQSLSLSLPNESIALLAEQTQGNLLACDNILQQCALTYGQTAVSHDQLEALIYTQTHFTPFQLIDSLYAGQTEHSLAIAQSLKAEQTPLTLMLWSITQAVESLYQIHEGLESGESKNIVFKKFNIWPKRQNAVNAALKRLPRAFLQSLLGVCARIDTMIKTGENSLAWQAIDNMIICLSSVPRSDIARTAIKRLRLIHESRQ